MAMQKHEMKHIPFPDFPFETRELTHRACSGRHCKSWTGMKSNGTAQGTGLFLLSLYTIDTNPPHNSLHV